MPYIERDRNHEIIAIYRDQKFAEMEFLAPDHLEVIAFLATDSDTSISALSESDKDIARVTEDLIHLLIAKNVILFTELPAPVQQKLLALSLIHI